jgi:hypothetical protein
MRQFTATSKPIAPRLGLIDSIYLLFNTVVHVVAVLAADCLPKCESPNRMGLILNWNLGYRMLGLGALLAAAKR